MLWLLSSSFVALPALAQKSAKTKTVTTAAPPEFNTSSTETDYILGPGDRLRVDIFQVPDFSREYLVLVDGSIGFPLVGNLKVQGMTLSQLNDLLSQRYALYVKRPVVTVSLLSPRPLKVAIAGEVNSPGSYTLSLSSGQEQKFPSVTDLIQQAGGLTGAADISKVQIQRFFQGKQQLLTLNLWQLLQQGQQSQNISLRDGDTLIIPTKDAIDPAEVRQLADANFGIQSNKLVTVAIVGEVYRPGSYKLTESEGIQSSRTTSTGQKTQYPRLSQAIEKAGGIKPLADIRQIQVRRLTRTGEPKTLQVDLWQLLQAGNLDEDIILQDGDTISIPTATAIDPKESESLAAASFAPEKIRVNVVGEVKKPGVVEVPPNTPLNQVILAAGGFDDRRANTSSVNLVRLNPNGTVSKRDISVDFARGVDEDKNPAMRNNDVVVVERSGVATASDTLNTFLSPLGSFLGIGNLLRVFGL
jgi:polysaccharide export outer membrane protein